MPFMGRTYPSLSSSETCVGGLLWRSMRAPPPINTKSPLRSDRDPRTSRTMELAAQLALFDPMRVVELLMLYTTTEEVLRAISGTRSVFGRHTNPLPETLLSSVFAYLSVRDHVRLECCSRLFARVGRLPASSPALICIGPYAERQLCMDPYPPGLTRMRPLHLHLRDAYALTPERWLGRLSCHFVSRCRTLHLQFSRSRPIDLAALDQLAFLTDLTLEAKTCRRGQTGIKWAARIHTPLSAPATATLTTQLPINRRTRGLGTLVSTSTVPTSSSSSSSSSSSCSNSNSRPSDPAASSISSARMASSPRAWGHAPPVWTQLAEDEALDRMEQDAWDTLRRPGRSDETLDWGVVSRHETSGVIFFPVLLNVGPRLRRLVLLDVVVCDDKGRFLPSVSLCANVEELALSGDDVTSYIDVICSTNPFKRCRSLALRGSAVAGLLERAWRRDVPIQECRTLASLGLWTKLESLELHGLVLAANITLPTSPLHNLTSLSLNGTRCPGQMARILRVVPSLIHLRPPEDIVMADLREVTATLTSLDARIDNLDLSTLLLSVPKTLPHLRHIDVLTRAHGVNIDVDAFQGAFAATTHVTLHHRYIPS